MHCAVNASCHASVRSEGSTGDERRPRFMRSLVRVSQCSFQAITVFHKERMRNHLFEITTRVTDLRNPCSESTAWVTESGALRRTSCPENTICVTEPGAARRNPYPESHARVTAAPSRTPRRSAPCWGCSRGLPQAVAVRASGLRYLAVTSPVASDRSPPCPAHRSLVVLACGRAPAADATRADGVAFHVGEPSRLLAGTTGRRISLRRLIPSRGA